MSDNFETRVSKVFILSISESEIVYFADRDEIGTRVPGESRTPVPSPSASTEAKESSD